MGKLFEHAVNLLMLYIVDNREEKSSHHIVMVAKFLVNNKSKRLLKSGFALHRSYHVLSILAKFSGLNPKGPYLSLEKETENFCVVRVVKSSQLPVKIAAYLFSISQLLCLAFL